MTDWDLMTSQIKIAMSAVEEAHHAGMALKEGLTAEKLTAFQKQMLELVKDLEDINYFMSHEDLVFSDDVADALSEVFTGKPAPYRKSQR